MTEDNRTIKIICKDNIQRIIPYGTSILTLSNEYKKDYKSKIIAAKVNNDIKELTYNLIEDCTLEFIDTSNIDGNRIYRRSLYFIMIKAVYDLFPDLNIKISHTISKGLFIDVKGNKEISKDDVEKIESRMRELVNCRIPFIKRVVPFSDAKEILLKSGRADRYHAIEYREKPFVTIYNCDGYDDYFYGYMAPNTGYVDKFKLIYYPPGIILMSPEAANPESVPEFVEQKKLFNIFMENKKWVKILEVENVGALNDRIKEDRSVQLIRVSEALQEKKVALIADRISENENKKSVVLIAGPSSSGKTTFAQRLDIQLRVNGLRPITISLDDYFVDRDSTPTDKAGEFDYESIDAIDLKLFNSQLTALINKEEVEIPVFNFHTGAREPKGRKIRLEQNQIIIIEGIHGLNEKLTRDIASEDKFKIYVSALTSMNIDDHNRIPTTDTRIIRRIVRDFQFRNCNAISTMKRWASVRRGEEINIFPFQEEADIMFNSSLVYELSVLKTFAEPLLKEVDSMYEEYPEARRLIEFLSYILPIDPKEIPDNSIIREFIGGSCFS
ncbi:MAG: nucleoside kinase [Clostridia bacterium]|jgi:uridine kinase